MLASNNSLKNMGIGSGQVQMLAVKNTTKPKMLVNNGGGHLDNKNMI